MALPVFNTGYVPFSLGPIYISNDPSGVGATVFDYTPPVLTG